METTTHTTDTPTEFKISAFTLINMYKNFEEIDKYPMVTYSESELKAREHTNTLQFNAFKILFREELKALNLNVDCQI